MKQWHRRLFAAFLILSLSCSQAAAHGGVYETEHKPVTAARAQTKGMQAFVQAAPQRNPFADVTEADSCYAAVLRAYGLGLVTDTDKHLFLPEHSLSVKDALTLAVRTYQLYHGLPLSDTDVDIRKQALQYALLPTGLAADDAPITRLQAAVLLRHILPLEELPAIRSVCYIPDLAANCPEYDGVLTVYRAGILSGTDYLGTLAGRGEIPRAAFIVLLDRLMLPEMRCSEPLQNPQGLRAFIAPKEGEQLAFSDIDTKSWYYKSLLSLCRLGLVSHTATTFAPCAGSSYGGAALRALPRHGNLRADGMVSGLYGNRAAVRFAGRSMERCRSADYPRGNCRFVLPHYATGAESTERCAGYQRSAARKPPSCGGTRDDAGGHSFRQKLPRPL